VECGLDCFNEIGSLRVTGKANMPGLLARSIDLEWRFVLWRFGSAPETQVLRLRRSQEAATCSAPHEQDSPMAIGTS